MTETAPAVEVRETNEYDIPDEPRTGLLVTLALAWLTVILWLAQHFTLAASGTQLALIGAAIALPTVVAASLLAGAAVGLGTASVLAKRGVTATRQLLPRIGVGALPGLVTGGLAGAWILLTWQVGGSTVALAVAVGLAGVLGGATAAALPRPVAAAAVAATLAVFIAGFVINLLRERLMGLFGADGSPASQYSAFRWFALTAAGLSALVGGLVAYWHLRRAEPRTARWPAYLLAGMAPGLMLMLTEVITRFGGARLLALAGTSEPDGAAFAWDAKARFNHALVVLFLGPIIAMIAFGRTLPRRDDPDTEADPDELEGTETADVAADVAAADSRTSAGQPN